MPQAHRDTDLRTCSAKTVVIGQNTVFVNNLLWAVDRDIDDHCAPYGPLKPTETSIRIGSQEKPVIVVGDGFYVPDFEPPICVVEHQPFAATGSPNVFAYSA